MAQFSQTTNTPLVAEDDDWNDTDSAIGAPSITSSTTSIGESILQYRKENGRTYHAYKDGQYLMPNDEAENDRADLQHHLTILTLENKLFLSPAGKENTLHRVLDVGTGTGIWAIDFADEHPESEVLGIDLSPIQPSFVPANVAFQVDDLDQRWTFSNKFDFIYCRMMTGSFSDWPRFFTQAFQNLNPGGFLELLDPLYPVVTDDDTFPPNSAIVKWCQYIMKAAASNGHPLQTATDYKTQMKDAGFVNVKEHVFKWPLNRWPKDKKAKELGMWVHAAVADGLESISLASLTRIIGMTLPEAEVFLSEVRKEMKDTKIHAYFPIYVLYGQKPK